MSDEKTSNVKDIIDSATGLVKSVPIYDDAVQPLAKEVGKAFGTLGKTVNIALSPLEGLVWGYDKFKNFISTDVTEKLKNTPTQNIKTPNLHLAGPAFEAMKYTGETPELRNSFANLLANSMDMNTANSAHPSFVDIIKNLTSDEAKILKYFSNRNREPLINVNIDLGDKKGVIPHKKNHSYIGINSKCENNDLVPSYIDNLCRLGILNIPSEEYLVDENFYYQLIEDWDNYKKDLIKQKLNIRIDKRYIELTNFGKEFIRVCINDKK